MESLRKKILWISAAVAFIVFTGVLAHFISRPEIAETVTLKSGMADLDMARIRENVRQLSSPPSRMTGYPGADAATQYVLQQIRDLGIPESNIAVQEFETASPIVKSANLSTSSSAGNAVIRLYPLWPNLARTSRTSSAGVTGPLVDAGKGSDEAMKGKPLRDSIVVMDWDSREEWMKVPEFGGKAIIFRGNMKSAGAFARMKYLSVPANIPRFYVEAKDVPALDTALKAGANGSSSYSNATIHCEMDWQRVRAKNILVQLSGRDSARTAGGTDVALGDSDAARRQARQPAPPGNLSPLVFHAYTDSNSVVPERSPGAEQSIGSATLLELGRYFTQLTEKPSRPVYLLFTGAHGQAMTGISHFAKLLREVEEARGKSANDNPKMRALLARMGKPGLLVGLDLSSHSSQMGVFCMGAYYDFRDNYLRPKFSVLGLKLAEAAAKYYNDPKSPPPVPSFVDCINLTSGRGWWTYFPYQSAFESEIPMLAGYPAITLATINDERFYVDTPDDTFDQVRFDQLESQLVARKGQSAGLGVMAQSLAFWNGPYISSELIDESGELSGRSVWLNQEKSYTPNDPLAGATVFLKRGTGDRALLGTCGLSPAITDADGKFTFPNLFMGSAWWLTRMVTTEAYGVASPDFLKRNAEACSQFTRVRNTQAGSPRQLEANGDIIYGMDMARPQEYPWTARIAGRSQSVNLVMFPCKAITLFGLTDPRGYLNLTDAQILEASTKSPPFEFGRSQVDGHWRLPPENCVTIWANPSLRAYLTLGLGFVKKRLVLVNDPTPGQIGKGFVLSELENLPSMALQGASDMAKLDEERVKKLESHGINNPRVRKLRAEAKRNLDSATQALAVKDYSTYRVATEKAWSLEGKAYGELLDTANNMIKGVLFYLALLLPFSYCMERLLLASGAIQKRMLWMLVIFGASFGILVIAHPAFRFTLTPFLVLLAFVILALALTVGILLLGKFDNQLRERKREVAGLHEDSANTGNIAIRAIDLGIANIRRRPQRGFLTGMTIVLVTFTLLSFTSVVPEISISHLKHPTGVATYPGLLARDKDWWGLPLPLLDSLKRDFGGVADSQGSQIQNQKSKVLARPPAQNSKSESVVSTRGWFYSDYAGNVSQIDLRALPKEESTAAASPSSSSSALSTGTFTVSSLLCMEPSEPLVSRVDKTLIAGRWFKPGEEEGIILPSHVARMLGYGASDIGRPIQVFGNRLSLVGIVDEKKFDVIKDLDGEPLTPVNFVLQKEMMMKRENDDKPDTIELYIHYSTDQIAIVPLSLGRRLGATIRSVAVRMNGNADPESAAADFTKRSNQTILASNGKTVTLFAAIDTSSMTIIGQIFIPVLLGFLMVLGTMLGSVYERRREISVYNSVGLSPGNIAALFLAESSVYAMVGACMGYLLGQVVAKVLLTAGLLSSLSLNYSAGSTVFVSLFTMAIVLISTLYPARQAFLAAIPDSHKRTGHAAGEEYSANTLSFYLPFVATPGSIFAMQAYMHEYLDSVQGVTIGQLAVDDLKTDIETQDGETVPVLSFRAWLAPFDLGVGQDVKLRIAYRKDTGIHQYHLSAVLYSGDQQNWRRLTPRFVQALRKQLLMWRILTPEEHAKYTSKGEALFGILPGKTIATTPEPSPEPWLNEEKGLA